MSDTLADVRSTCVAKLAGLDEDILEYVIGMLEGDEDEDEKSEALSGFLMSCDYCKSEEEASAKCADLLTALRPSVDVSDAAAAEADAAPLRLLGEKMSLADTDSKLFRAEDDSGLGGRLVDIDEALKGRKKRKAAS